MGRTLGPLIVTAGIVIAVLGILAVQPHLRLMLHANE